MSKQTGLIRLDGTIGGISFYKLNGEDIAKVANGPKKERIHSEPAFQRTRENNAEFGGSATAAKSMRLALAVVLQTMADERLAAPLTKLFKEINLKGIGTRGQRPIIVSGNRTMLENLDFNIHSHMSSVFNAPFSYSNNAARVQGTITVPDFLPSSFISAPAGATHFQLLTAIGAVSDYAFNTTTLHYDATDPVLNTLSGIAYGAVTALNITTPVNFSLVANLPGTPTMTPTVSVAQCLGIQFFQQVGVNFYLLAQGNAMKSVKLF